MKKIFYLFPLLVLLSCMVVVSAVPTVSFTYTLQNNKINLHPQFNDETTHIQWTLIRKSDNQYSETRWIPQDDIRDHIKILEQGDYFITLTGKNTTTGVTRSFTRSVKVNIRGSTTIEPNAEEEDVIDAGSRIINNLPEPLRGFFKARTTMELAAFLFLIIVIAALLIRRKKTRTYVHLESIKK